MSLKTRRTSNQQNGSFLCTSSNNILQNPTSRPRKGRRFLLLANLVLLSWNADVVRAFSGAIHHSRPLDRLESRHFPSNFRQNRRHSQKSPRFYRSSTTQLQSAAAMPSISWFYLSLLAVQFGCQPLLTKAYAPSNIIRSTVVLAQDIVRFLLCGMFLMFSGSWNAALHQWTLKGALLGAGIPSMLYLIQNYCALMAYQNLPPITFNVLNQTKTLSAALCCFLVMGRRQSRLQVVSLLMLLLSALVIEKVVPIFHWKDRQSIEEEKDQKAIDLDSIDQTSQMATGVVPVLIASVISGLGKFKSFDFHRRTKVVHTNIPFLCVCGIAGALSQRNLQTLGCNSYVFSMELAFFSSMIMLASMVLGSPDGKKIRKDGIGEGWTWKTWIPVIANASGGVVVGLVTKHAGAVKKGFALIFGLILSGILQKCFLSDEGLSSEQVAGGILASLSLWMHSNFPPS
jgi:UDP-sugar transporter A1/2/3